MTDEVFQYTYEVVGQTWPMLLVSGANHAYGKMPHADIMKPQLDRIRKLPLDRGQVAPCLGALRDAKPKGVGWGDVESALRRAAFPEARTPVVGVRDERTLNASYGYSARTQQTISLLVGADAGHEESKVRLRATRGLTEIEFARQVMARDGVR